ncbi:hypothetical protein TVAG_366030 [Trichomonas vaginalis G3]|uniref:Autophagy-related protein 17 n=1 Tax=Trichomonas vaginalis (strain ATCC PRA-98 / G3) TaxID=412133 RepID=A2DHP7_TRIV3|nr:BAR/IMD domain-like family [Trichomonas vaginalis G3]EAY20095.1 hypothetical protein TVAG_366030 [Trichomonas vaginalis G3]KAI5528048.1 BAR/IMD domain-like family [Trichomonas vaginalis G3]|eukprot:XP_001581081.1 hypothetical protein [Trichomonas vaginalis G3]
MTEYLDYGSNIDVINGSIKVSIDIMNDVIKAISDICSHFAGVQDSVTKLLQNIPNLNKSKKFNIFKKNEDENKQKFKNPLKKLIELILQSLSDNRLILEMLSKIQNNYVEYYSSIKNKFEADGKEIEDTYKQYNFLYVSVANTCNSMQESYLKLCEQIEELHSRMGDNSTPELKEQYSNLKEEFAKLQHSLSEITITLNEETQRYNIEMEYLLSKWEQVHIEKETQIQQYILKLFKQIETIPVQLTTMANEMQLVIEEFQDNLDKDYLSTFISNLEEVELPKVFFTPHMFEFSVSDYTDYDRLYDTGFYDKVVKLLNDYQDAILLKTGDDCIVHCVNDNTTVITHKPSHRLFEIPTNYLDIPKP